MYLNEKLKEIVGEPGARAPLKSKVGTLEHLIGWLEGQPADREYHWYDICNCAMRHYFVEGCGAATRPSGSAEAEYMAPFSGMREYHRFGMATPWTMGAALERARKIQAERDAT